MRAEAEVRAVLDAAVDAIITIDTVGTITDFNPAAVRIFGYERAAVLGNNVSMLMPSPDRDRHDQYLNAYLKTGVAKIVNIGREVVGRRSDGHTFPMYLAVSEVVLDGQLIGFAGIVRDLSRERALEAQLARQREELAHVGRIATLGEMASGIAHEVNQPLTAISAYAQACRRILDNADRDLPRDLSRPLEQIEKQAVRAAQVIQRLRGFLKKREEEKTEVEINAVIRTALELVDFDMRSRGAQLSLQLTEGLPAVVADAVQLQQVIVNLVRNALESTEDDPVRIEVRSRLQDSQVVVEIQDNGDGIGEEVAERLFTPFFSTKARGMGIGLSISQSILTSHEGRLWHSNAPGGGAVFHFCLNANR